MRIPVCSGYLLHVEKMSIRAKSRQKMRKFDKRFESPKEKLPTPEQVMLQDAVVPAIAVREMEQHWKNKR